LHEALQKAYLAAFQAMLEASGGPPEEFIRRRDAQGVAWINAESARLELQHHKREHTGAT
jgi:hypothetical protein